MSSMSFIENIEAKNARTGFEMLTERAVEMFGNDRYNGTISTCYMGRHTNSFDSYRKGNYDKAVDIILKKHYGNEKGVANIIDLGIKHYEVITVKKVVSPKENAPKYKMAYVVQQYPRLDLRVFSNKTEADEHALKLQLENPQNMYEVAKKYALCGGNQSVTRIEVSVKTHKTKPKLKNMKNRRIIPIHEYVFYGWAYS